MTEVDEEALTPEEAEALKQLGLGYPQAEEKVGLFSFLKDVFKGKDTSKVGNVDKIELEGIRNNKKVAVYARTFNLDVVADYIQEISEIDLATSLSKEGFLIDKAVTVKREMSARIGKGGGKSKWFKKNVQQ